MHKSALAALALIGGALLHSSPAAADAAAAQRLTAQLRDHVQRQEVPPMDPAGSYIFFVGQQRVQMDANQMRQTITAQRALMTSYSINDFRVHGTDCGADMCWIRYGYRFSASTGATNSTGTVSNQEFWFRNGETFQLILGVSRQ